MKKLYVITRSKVEMIDITDQVSKAVMESKIEDGICHLFVPHTTAAITINENADPNVIKDITSHMSKVVPEEGDFRHSEGNSDGHIKSSLFGVSLTVFVQAGRLVLGTWQGIYFCEFDGPRNRQVYIRVR